MTPSEGRKDNTENMSNNNNRNKKKGMNPRTKAFITGATFIFAILVIILCIMSGALTFKANTAKTTPTPPPTVTAPAATPTPSATATAPVQSSEPSKPVTYNVTVFAGHGGTTDPQGTMTVNAGDDITVHFIPDNGFAVSTITVNGELVDAAESYTVTNVSDNMTIDVSFDTAVVETPPPADVTQPAQ